MALTKYFGRLARKVENGRSSWSIIDITRSNQSLQLTADRSVTTLDLMRESPMIANLGSVSGS
jgi:hypothetical protein